MASTPNFRRHRAGENKQGRSVQDLIDACRPPATSATAPAGPAHAAVAEVVR